MISLQLAIKYKLLNNKKVRLVQKYIIVVNCITKEIRRVSFGQKKAGYRNVLSKQSLNKN